MNVVVVTTVVAALLCLVTSILRSPQAGRYHRSIRQVPPRFLRRRCRKAATVQARELARAIIEGRPDPVAHLAAGAVLQPNENAWLRAPARLAVRTSQPAWTADTQLRWLARRARFVSRATTTEGWRDYGEINWLITSQRITGRLTGNGEMLSVWWSGLAGVDINLKRDRVVFNGTNGWTGMLTGPTVVPIAVAAVAMCHGFEALLMHPALQSLDHGSRARSSRPPEPECVGAAGTIVNLQARRGNRVEPVVEFWNSE